MSYEKVKVLGVRQITKKDSGEIHRFLQVEVLSQYDIYLNQEAQTLLSQFQKLAGKEVLLPVTWGEYNGHPSLNLSGDFKPMLIPSSV